MSREAEIRFSSLPQIDIKRSKFETPQDYKFSGNFGQLLPIFCAEVLPGDTCTIDMGSIVRMTTPIFPVLDNSFMDTYFFFVPNRLIWQHWREFCGENRQTFWEQPVQYTIPQIKSPEGGWSKGSIADYFGIPTKVNVEVNALPFRAYTQIVNDWFVDENNMNPCMMNIDDTTIQGVDVNPSYDLYSLEVQKGGNPFRVCKVHDYFTSCLPSPQKGPTVHIPIANSMATVKTGEPISQTTQWTLKEEYPLQWGGVTTKLPITLSNQQIGIGNNTAGLSVTKTVSAQNAGEGVAPINLYADLETSGIASIAELRQAFAVQRYYETIAKSGSRYIEWVKGVFGVTSSDARMQRSEYIGGFRQNINMDQVIQTSATDNVSPQGNTAAFSCTAGSHHIGTYSSQEHGWIIGLMCLRHDLTYQQGLHKMWTRKTLFDHYLPQFANLSEMPVYNENLYCQGTDVDKEVFGYQEAWAEYRYRPSLVVGAMRSNYTQTLDSWHYADYYTELPHLSYPWIVQGQQNVDRTLAVQSSEEDQVFGDIHFKVTWIRPMPLYSIPGLIDHH